MASTNNYINEYETLEEMNAAYESDHSGSWVAYCAEDNNLYYQQKTSISSKYFDNLEYNSGNKTLDFYIDGEVKKSIDVSPWWFERDNYYTREETNELLLPKFDNVVYDSSAKTINFYSGTEVKKSIDATDFIKDGMVDNVQVVVSSDTKSYLEITFNTDSEGKKTHDTVYLDLTKIFNPENYYTKTDSDGKYVTGIGTDNKSLTYTINGNTTSLTIPYAASTPWSGVINTPTTLNGYGITNQVTGIRGIMFGDNNPQYVWLFRIQINGTYIDDCLDLAVRRRYTACDIKMEIKHGYGPDSSYPILSGGTQVRYYYTDWYNAYGLKNYASAVYYVTKISEDGKHDVVDIYTYKDCNWDTVGYNISNWMMLNVDADWPEEGKSCLMLIDKMVTVAELPSDAVLIK